MYVGGRRNECVCVCVSELPCVIYIGPHVDFVVCYHSQFSATFSTLVLSILTLIPLLSTLSVCILPYFVLFFLYITYMSVVCLFCMCIRVLVQSISVFLLAVFLWALLPEIKWMMILYFHSFSLLISSSSVSAITAKSSAYSSFHGRATLNSLDMASMTITNNSGLNPDPWCIPTVTSKPLLLPLTVLTTVFSESGSDLDLLNLRVVMSGYLQRDHVTPERRRREQ